MTSFIETFVKSVSAIPGVESAAASGGIPFKQVGWSSDFTAEGWPPDRFGIDVLHDEATPALFQTMRVPLLRGREFDWSDSADAPRVVIVNQALADRYFPGENPIGQRIAVRSGARARLSLARDRGRGRKRARRDSSARGRAHHLRGHAARGGPRPAYPGAEQRNPEALSDLVRSSLRALDPPLPLYDVTTLEEMVSSSVAREKFLLALLSASALVALTLASVGIGGVVSQSTGHRVREIGIRMALGAEARSVVALVVREGMQPVLAGIAAGAVPRRCPRACHVGSSLRRRAPRSRRRFSPWRPW